MPILLPAKLSLTTISKIQFAIAFKKRIKMLMSRLELGSSSHTRHSMRCAYIATLLGHQYTIVNDDDHM